MDGLQGPISVNDIRASSQAKTLTIGTIGYGAYQIDLGSDAVTEDVALCVRDDVFDHGKLFVSGPDPEHPVPDPTDPNFRVAASGGAGLQFFNSTDIRIDVPSRSKPRNRVDSVDHVSFELTPIDVPEGFPGTIVDNAPHPGDQARVFVQVTNLGTQPAHDVRVFVMWREPTVGPLSLPADFWTTTFPNTGPSCGPLDPSSGWHALTGLNGSDCVTLPLIRPEMPEVAGFSWSVPTNVPQHVCMLAFVESNEDPLDPSMRGSVFDLATLVPQSRHFAQRNLYPVGASDLIKERVHLMDERSTPFRLRFDRPWLDHATRLAVLLPHGTHGPIHGMRIESPPSPPSLTAGLMTSGLDLSTLYVTDPDSTWASIENLRVKTSGPPYLLVVYGGSPKNSRRAQRFMIRTENQEDGKVLGGATWVIRPAIAPAHRAKPKDATSGKK
jgi:hypothetical protein